MIDARSNVAKPGKSNEKPGNLKSWDAGTVYDTNGNQFVEYLEGGKSKIWKSLIADNQGNEPFTDSPYWLESSVDELQVVHYHSNLETLDGIDEARASEWDAAAALAHGHSNYNILELIQSENLTNNFERGYWNGKADSFLTGGAVYVSPGGDNANGAANRMDRPFKTIAAAILAGNFESVSTIILMGGTYTNETLEFTSSGSVNRLILENGARITSNGLITIKVGVGNLAIEGRANATNTEFIIAGNCIIENTHASGSVFEKGNNPGNVYLNLSNLTIRSTGLDTNVDTGATNFYNVQIFARHCLFETRTRVIKGSYGANCYVDFDACKFNLGSGYMAQMGLSDNVHGEIKNCYSRGGYFVQMCYTHTANNRLIVQNCNIQTTVGAAFDIVDGGNAVQGANVILQGANRIIAQTEIIKGRLLNLLIDGGQYQSLTTSPVKFTLTTTGGFAEIANCKLVAESAQSTAVVNNNGSSTEVHLLNVRMNKGVNANVLGLYNNVVVDARIKMV